MLSPPTVDPVVRVHGDDLVFGYELLDERHDRFRQDDACRRRPLEDHAEQRKIEMVEVLVGDQDGVDALGGKPERRRCDEPIVVRRRPRVDDEARLSDVDPESRLAEPRQSRPALRRSAGSRTPRPRADRTIL